MKLTRLQQLIFGLMTLFIIGLVIVIYTDQKIQKSIQEKSFLRPTTYYSSPTKFFRDQVMSLARFKAYFQQENYRERPFGSPLTPGDYSLGDQQQCRTLSGNSEDIFQCVLFRPRFDKKLNVLMLNEWDKIIGVYAGEELEPQAYAQGEAPVFAQYLGDKPTQQLATEISDIPRYCLDAVLAIEDPLFLEHSGVSLKGILRAVWANLRSTSYSQGGSTITQQLVKNYFLTPEKTIRRKLKEILMSLIFEFRVSKDDILETYLNIIYLGQSGVFEVRGYGSAAEFYFQKEISQLDLPQCALLAAIVNSPGRYNPIKYPERAKTRRERVLEKMLEHNRITPEEMQQASQAPLPTQVKTHLSASAPYYVDAAKKQLAELNITNLSGLRVYTALDPQAQQWAEEAVTKGLAFFQNNVAKIKKLKEERGKNLEAALLASDPHTGEVVAIVGGRQFSTSPFNRAVESRRQVGSVFKPIVYYTAIKNKDLVQKNNPDQEPLTPLTLLNNSPYRLEYEGQVWEPKNYDGEFSAPVPLFYALKESINVPTARLAMQVGLEPIIESARQLGVTSDLKAYPSISLGAFELSPLEVLKVYNTISQMGRKKELQIVKQVKNQASEILYENPRNSEVVGDEQSFAILIGMMKETLISGTGAYSRQMGFRHVAAGKTGTTSDTKDAWFAGFTPFHTAVVWVGYDDGTPHGMTGASAALPIWTNYMRKIATTFSNQDFPWPDDVEEEEISVGEMSQLGVPAEKQKPTTLIRRKTSWF